MGIFGGATVVEQYWISYCSLFYGMYSRMNFNIVHHTVMNTIRRTVFLLHGRNQLNFFHKDLLILVRSKPFWVLV